MLIDTGVLFAFLNRDDQRHREAVKLVERIAAGTYGAPFTTDFVVDELFTLIRARTKNAKLEDAAKALLPLPTPALVGFRVLSLGTDRLGAVAARFLKQRAQGLSFTDASLLVCLEDHGIDRLATFDQGLAALVDSVPQAG